MYQTLMTAWSIKGEDLPLFVIHPIHCFLVIFRFSNIVINAKIVVRIPSSVLM